MHKVQASKKQKDSLHSPTNAKQSSSSNKTSSKSSSTTLTVAPSTALQQSSSTSTTTTSKALVPAASKALVPQGQQQLTQQLQQTQATLAQFQQKYHELESATAKRFEDLDKKMPGSQATVKTLFTKVLDISLSVKEHSKQFDTKLENSLRPLQTSIVNLDQTLDNRIQTTLSTGPLGASLSKLDSIYDYITASINRQSSAGPPHHDPSIVTGVTEDSTISSITTSTPIPAPNSVPMSPTPTPATPCLTGPMSSQVSSQLSSTQSTEPSGDSTVPPHSSRPNITLEVKKELIAKAQQSTKPSIPPLSSSSPALVHIDTPSSGDDNTFIPVSSHNRSPSKNYSLEQFNRNEAKLAQQRSPVKTRSHQKAVQPSRASQSGLTTLTSLVKPVSARQQPNHKSVIKKSNRQSHHNSNGSQMRRTG